MANMTTDQALILSLIAAMMVLFIWGKWRHDIVAMMALMAAIAAGLVPQREAFNGFSQPAVITVACVLVLSRALQRSGLVDAMARQVIPEGRGTVLPMLVMTGLAALLSAFMNNVGALALVMPVAIRMAGDMGMSPGQVLMPLSFATILGGMTTLIGTPPNLIVSGFREQSTEMMGYGMFDFAPVGVPVALAGVLFLALIGWRMVPRRSGGLNEEFNAGSYVTEVKVMERSRLVGCTLIESEHEMREAGAQVIGLVRNGVRLTAPRGSRQLLAGDILLVEADLDTMVDLLGRLGLRLEEQVAPRPAHHPAPEPEARPEPDLDDDLAPESTPSPLPHTGPAAPAAAAAAAASEAQAQAAEVQSHEAREIVLREYVVRPDSTVIGRSPIDIGLRTRYSVNLLAVSRKGARSTTRLRSMIWRSGDLLLLQGARDSLAEFAADTGVIPLAERKLDLPDRRSAIAAAGIMALAVMAASFGLTTTTVAFAMAVLAAVLTGTIPLRELYTSIDWTVIVLLAALIPVAAAMETTGAAALVAGWLLDGLAQGNMVLALLVVLIVTMFLSDVINNAACAAVMCPIALSIAASLGSDPDRFLMAVAIGASCAFLTPIGHQNNTLILGPGGFRFGDYWKVGLVVEVIVVVVSIPLLLMVW